MLAAAASGAALPPPAPVPRHARLVLIGDGLGDPDALAARLGALAERHVDGVLMQIVDPAEAELPFAGRVMFDGLEGEGSALIGNVGEVRERYRRLFRAHGEALRDMARRRGWTFVRHRTDRSAESGLLALYQSMAPRRGH